MGVTIGTRIRNNFVWGAGHRLNRAFQNKYRGDVGGLHIEATDISFTNPSTITSASSTLPIFQLNEVVRVQGSQFNNAQRLVLSSTSSTLTVYGSGITTEAAGASVQVSQV